MDQLTEAGTGEGPLSFADRLCLVLARDEGYVCVTNDRRLRSECSRMSVAVLWGLELMVELVRRKHLSARTATETARAIHASNPQHISASVIMRFEEKVRSLSSE